MKRLSLIIGAYFVIQVVSCKPECKDCTYYELNDNDSIVFQDPLDGQYCGDEIKVIEKKEYHPISGSAYVKCE
ncbi:MAG: hypothetical protein R2813_04930 [Flavobacteriales bacterium]